MSHERNQVEPEIPGIGPLLEALGVSIVDGVVTLPFDLGQTVAGAHLAAIGWATVELDRAEADLGAQLGTSFEPTNRDALLGATVRRSTGIGPPIFIEEPDTEGRLTGALAKHGEGPVALYLRVTDLSALPGTLSIRAGSGPLGPARLVLDGKPWGPFLILVGPPGPPSEPPPPDAERVPSEP
jgi:hypothetical protein